MCEHKYVKKVRNHGKKGKVEYIVCKKCKKLLTMEEIKSRKCNKKRKSRRLR